MNASDQPNPSAAGSPNPLSASPWFYAFLSCLLLTVLLSFRLITSSDLGYHLRGGQWILENLRFPAKDVYTYTVSFRDYLDIHWLYQVLLFIVYKIGSYPLLTVFNTVLILAVFLLSFWRLRLTGAPWCICVFLLGAMLLASEPRFQVRPEIMSWLLMSFILWVLEMRSNQNRDFLFLLPLIQVLWVNIEGLFGIGCVLMGIYVLTNLLRPGARDKSLMKYSALAVAGCLINPNFIQGVLFPLSHMLTLGTSNVFKQNINEFQSTWSLAQSQTYLFLPDLYLWIYKIFSFFLAFLLIATFRKRKLHEFLIAISFFCLSATAIRNIAIFMLATAPMAAAAWKDLEWKWLQKFQRIIFEKPFSAWIFIFLIIGFCLRVITGAYYAQDRREGRFGQGLDREILPLQATQFLVDNKLDGRILNHLNTGGWLDWKGPQKVFIDGRLEVMGEKFFSEYMMSFNKGGLISLADRYQADIVFFNHFAAPLWVFDLKGNPNWRLVYLDEYFSVYLRKGYRDEVKEFDYDRLLSDCGIEKNILPLAPGLIQAPDRSFFQRWLEGFYRPKTFPRGLMTAALFCTYHEHFRESEALYLEAIRRTQGAYFEFYLNLGWMYFINKRYGEARICEEKVLRDDPTNPVALDLLSKIPGRSPL